MFEVLTTLTSVCVRDVVLRAGVVDVVTTIDCTGITGHSVTTGRVVVVRTLKEATTLQIVELEPSSITTEGGTAV